jgi:hypothetical protein
VSAPNGETRDAAGAAAARPAAPQTHLPYLLAPNRDVIQLELLSAVSCCVGRRQCVHDHPVLVSLRIDRGGERATHARKIPLRWSTSTATVVPPYRCTRLASRLASRRTGCRDPCARARKGSAASGALPIGVIIQSCGRLRMRSAAADEGSGVRSLTRRITSKPQPSQHYGTATNGCGGGSRTARPRTHRQPRTRPADDDRDAA